MERYQACMGCVNECPVVQQNLLGLFYTLRGTHTTYVTTTSVALWMEFIVPRSKQLVHQQTKYSIQINVKLCQIRQQQAKIISPTIISNNNYWG